MMRQVLSAMLREGVVKDPRLEVASMITVTGVDVSPDLRMAHVHVSVFPDDPAVLKDVLAGLTAGTNALRRNLADRTGLRFTPELKFHYDGSIAYGAKIEALLRDVASSDAGLDADGSSGASLEKDLDGRGEPGPDRSDT